MEEEKKPSLIDDALAQIGRIAFIEPAICTGWVLVSEWMGEGEKDYDIVFVTLVSKLPKE